MKSIAINLKTLVMMAMAVPIAVIAIQSCSKSSSSTAPTVSGTSLASGATVSAGTSTTVTITGTNLTGATLSTTTAGVTITNTSVSGSTSITATVTVAANVSSGPITVTITTGTGATTTTTFTVVGIPLLGGYLSSDSVAYSNIVSYFTFNGNVNDTVGGETTTGVGVTFVPGVRGQAYQGAAAAYVTAPATSAVQALASFSVSLWYSLPTAAKPQNSGSPGPGGLFFLSGSNSGNDGNEIIIEADRPSVSQLAADSVPIHNGLSNIGSTTNYVGYTLTSFDTATSTWVHIVETYNDTSSTYVFYENGNPIACGSAFGTNLSTVLLNGPTGTGTPIGAPNWTPDPPATLFIGTWPPGLYGVSPTLGSGGGFLGAIDELRVYNIALSQSQITGLFLNGQAGR